MNTEQLRGKEGVERLRELRNRVAPVTGKSRQLEHKLTELVIY